MYNFLRDNNLLVFVAIQLIISEPTHVLPSKK